MSAANARLMYSVAQAERVVAGRDRCASFKVRIPKAKTYAVQFRAVSQRLLGKNVRLTLLNEEAGVLRPQTIAIKSHSGDGNANCFYYWSQCWPSQFVG